MTAAERKQRERDRRKAGLARLELWVPNDRVQEIRALVAAALDETPETAHSDNAE